MSIKLSYSEWKIVESNNLFKSFADSIENHNHLFYYKSDSLIDTNNSSISVSKSIESNLLESIPVSISSIYQFNYQYSLSNNWFIYDVGIFDNYKYSGSIDFIGIEHDLDVRLYNEIYTQFPLKLATIPVPKKAYTTISRYIPKPLLYEIHSNVDVAIEMCMIFISQLTSTYFTVKDGSSDGWKPLKAEYLRNLISHDPLAYKHTREALEYPLRTGPIIKCDYEHEIGVKSFHYKLCDAFIGRGISKYQLKTKEAINAIKSNFIEDLKECKSKPIQNNLLRIYPHVTLPTKAEMISEGKRLIKQGYVNKKGKKLATLNKHKKEYFKNADELCFIEDNIELADFLINSFGRIFSDGTPESGYRVVDSITLMPSWVRKLVKIDGELAIELDYSALHPNIAMAIYSGGTEYLTHDMVADESGVPKNMVKVEHLSFFNKNVWQMKKSILWKYYQFKEPKMLESIIAEKKSSKLGYKATSRRLFEKEVLIMTDVIKKLNSEGIYVLYVYDALLSHPRHANRVQQVMNETILLHGVKTTAKSSIEIKTKTIELPKITVEDCPTPTKKKQYFTAEQIRIGAEIKRRKTTTSISNVIHNWNIGINGEITPKGVSLKSGISLATVKKYWSQFENKLAGKIADDFFENNQVLILMEKIHVNKEKEKEELKRKRQTEEAVQDLLDYMSGMPTKDHPIP